MFIFTNIFYRKFPHILIPYRIRDNIFVQTIFKEFFCCAADLMQFLYGILCKNGCAGKTKHLNIIEEFFYPFMCITKLAAVTFIKNENHSFCPAAFHLSQVHFLVIAD